MRRRRAGVRRLESEDGSLTVFGLFVLVTMLVAAGLAVDTMRAERERVHVQAQLDRAVLVAANRRHALDPGAVVRDYMAHAGLEQMLGGVEVEDHPLTRRVSATATTQLPTVLMHLAGVDELPVAAAATAEEGQAAIEISLVLDVSTSMLRFNRMAEMKAAAKAFVSLVLPADGEFDTTVSIVPYSMSVNIGRDLLDHYLEASGTERLHDHSNCMIFEDADFEQTALPPTTVILQHAHVDPWDRGYEDGPAGGRRIRDPLCQRAQTATEDGPSPMVPLGADAADLHDAIDAMHAVGATGIDNGMRWGVAMLDPSSRSVVEHLIGGGRVDARASGRPHDYDAGGALKFVVLMTDGDPDGLRHVFPEVYRGASNVWHHPASGRYSVLLRGSHLAEYPHDRVPGNKDFPSHRCNNVWGPGEREALISDGIRRFAVAGGVDDRCPPIWYWPDLEGMEHRHSFDPGVVGQFRDHPYTSVADDDVADDAADPLRNDWDGSEGDWAGIGAELVRLDYPEVFDRFTSYDFWKHLYHHPYYHGWLPGADWDRFRHDAIKRDPASTVDRLTTLCDAAKRRDIVIFTVAFDLENLTSQEARERARGLMRECATSAAHYFDVDDVEIADAFGAIAGQISQLRLTR